MKKTKIRYISRETSWLSFNNRVLQEAADKSNPLIERIKFLGIFSNNLDEFFRVRVATLKRLTRSAGKRNSRDGANPVKVLNEVNQIVNEQQDRFQEVYLDILKCLEKEKIHIIDETRLSPEQSVFVKEYFNSTLRSHLFPILLSSLEDGNSLRDQLPYLAVELSRTDKSLKNTYAIIEIPSLVSRFLILPELRGHKYIILIDDVIRYCLEDIFHMFDYDHFEAYTFKFTRDAELDIDNDVSKSLMELISDSLKQRNSGRPIRFIYDETMPANLLKALRKKLNVARGNTLIGGGRYHNFRDFMNFPNIGSSKLEYPQMQPIPNPYLEKEKSIFAAIRKRDIMIHFPYQPFKYIIDLLREASIDPKVKSVKMTIYRVARNSNVISALINAARNGKDVTVLMELQARFDEQNNIYYAEKMQAEGVKVIQSQTGFKVHSKLILIRRREGNKDVLYANVGTGNFNEATAKVYTDDSLFTANPKITTEVDSVFNLFEFSYKHFNFKHLILSPTSTRDFILKMLNNEIKNARAGKDAFAIIKINNLVEEKLVQKLYQASKAGVKIRLIVRSTCVVMPQVPGMSDNIEAISIVDRYLEHSRILVFCNNGNEKYYISSADWMVRNFDYRIEVTCPVYSRSIQNELKTMLEIQLSDNTRARVIEPNLENAYKCGDDTKPVRAQYAIYDFLKEQYKN